MNDLHVIYSQDGNTAVMLSVLAGHGDVTRLLIQSGTSDMNIVNKVAQIFTSMNLIHVLT